MGTVNHLQRLISDLHTHTVYFRASLKACNKQSFLWGDGQSKAFYDIIELIAKIPSLHQKGSRVKCNASHNGLGACLEQEVEPKFGPQLLLLRVSSITRRLNIALTNRSYWLLSGLVNISVLIC